MQGPWDANIVEEGRHADLVALGGLYSRLAALQFGIRV